MNYEKVPNIISGKDLDYLSDMFNWNYGAYKNTYNAIEQVNDNEIKAIARHEITLNLENVIENASFILKNHGIFAMVHRTERMIEIIELMKKYRIEPKKIQFIYPKNGKNSDLFLIEGIKNGKNNIKPKTLIKKISSKYKFDESSRKFMSA